MPYMINARLEQGAPSLIIIDAVTGEERLHWRGGSAANVAENGIRDEAANDDLDWQYLFKRLVMLSCADQINLVQRALVQKENTPLFGDECITCVSCVDKGQ